MTKSGSLKVKKLVTLLKEMNQSKVVAPVGGTALEEGLVLLANTADAPGPVVGVQSGYLGGLLVMSVAVHYGVTQTDDVLVSMAQRCLRNLQKIL